MEIASYLGVGLSKILIKRFADGEIYVQLQESVRGCDVFLVQPTCSPVNENLMELFIMIDACRRASARSITVVIPYFGYARADRKAQGREAITAKLAANLLTEAGSDRVIVCDMHSAQALGYFDIPVDHIYGQPVILDYLASKTISKDLVVVSPDVGGVVRARAFAKKLSDAPLAIVDKRRQGHNLSEVMHLIGDVKGKVAIMVDDMIDTAGIRDRVDDRCSCRHPDYGSSQCTLHFYEYLVFCSPLRHWRNGSSSSVKLACVSCNYLVLKNCCNLASSDGYKDGSMQQHEPPHSASAAQYPHTVTHTTKRSSGSRQMATKSLLLTALLLIVSLAPHVVEADKQPALALVAGVVPCSTGSSINVAAVPPFPNAVVHMVCGGRVVAGTKADDSGAFNMNLGAVTSSLLVPLLGNQCKVVVITPLAACNPSLASVTGTLAAPVQLLGADSGSGSDGLGGLGGLIGLIGQIVGSLLGGILNIIPLPFSVV